MRRALLSVVAVALLAGPLLAQPQGAAEYVRAIYVKYLHKEPTPGELGFWLDKMNRGMSAAEMHANILGSNDFYARFGGNEAAWFNAAFVEVLGRPPRADEAARWGDRLRRRDGDRVKWAKDFLDANGGGRVPGGFDPGAGLPQADTAGQLVTSAQLLGQAIDAELPGRGGWLLKTQATQLLTTAAEQRPVLDSPAANPPAADAALRSLEGTAAALRGGLDRAGYAPTSRQYLAQVTALIATIRAGVPGVPVPPFPGNPGGLSPAEAETLRQQANSTARDTQRLENVLRGLASRDFQYAGVAREADALDNEVDRLRDELRPGASRGSIAARVRAISDRGGRMGALLGRPADGRLAQAWFEAQREINQLVAVAGTVPLPPGPNPGPFPPGPPPPQPDRRPFYAAIDAAVAQCDVLGTELEPFVRVFATAGGVHAGVTDLRQQLLYLRQGAVDLNRVNASLQQVNTQYQVMRQTPGMPGNAPDPREVNDAMRRLNRVAGN